MKPAAYVEQASEMAATLERREMQAALSRPVARARVASRFGVPASLLHSLRYRPPKTIAADVFDKLIAAVERQAFEQIKGLENEIATVRARRLGADHSRIREATASAIRARALLDGAVE